MDNTKFLKHCGTVIQKIVETLVLGVGVNFKQSFATTYCEGV